MSQFKYKEDEAVKEILDYLAATYNQHYVNKNNNDQTVDVWDALGSAETTCRDTALKYLMRYGKKAGKNRKDLLKAIHYIILLMYFQQREEAAETQLARPIVLPVIDDRGYT